MVTSFDPTQFHENFHPGSYHIGNFGSLRKPGISDYGLAPEKIKKKKTTF